MMSDPEGSRSMSMEQLQRELQLVARSDDRLSTAVTLSRLLDVEGIANLDTVIAEDSALAEIASDVLAAIETADPQLEAIVHRVRLKYLHDSRPRISEAAIRGLRYNRDPRDVDVVLAKGASEDAGVREAVAFVIPQIAARDEADQAQIDDHVVQVLIALTRDSDDEVRNWATYALGSSLGVASGDVRDALTARRTDPNDEVRCEALEGLSQMGDEQALLACLRDCDLSLGVLEAARHAQDPAVLDALRTAQAEDRWAGDPEELEAVIATLECRRS